MNCFSFSKTVLTCKDLKNQWLKTYGISLNKPNAIKVVFVLPTHKQEIPKNLIETQHKMQQNTVADFI